MPLALDQLDEFTALSALRDPFERLVVSAARVSKCKLFTRDEALSESGLVQTL